MGYLHRDALVPPAAFLLFSSPPALVQLRRNPGSQALQLLGRGRTQQRLRDQRGLLPASLSCVQIPRDCTSAYA